MTTVVTVYAREGIAYTDSRNVADVFGKGHGNVLRLIDTIREGLIKNDLTLWFIERHEQNAQNGQLYRHFEMTKDGAALLVMGFTSAWCSDRLNH